MLVSESSGIDCHISTQTQSLPDGELNVSLRHNPPFRFWDRAMNVLMTEAGWLSEWQLQLIADLPQQSLAVKPCPC